MRRLLHLRRIRALWRGDQQPDQAVCRNEMDSVKGKKVSKGYNFAVLYRQGGAFPQIWDRGSIPFSSPVIHKLPHFLLSIFSAWSPFNQSNVVEEAQREVRRVCKQVKTCLIRDGLDGVWRGLFTCCLQR